MEGVEDTGHSPWSGSQAKRYMSCPRSVRFQSQFPEQSSAYADRGTLAHSLGEACLRNDVDPEEMALFYDEYEVLDGEEIRAVKEYVDHVKSLDGELHIEWTMRFPVFDGFFKPVPKGKDQIWIRGTADAVVYDKKAKKLHVIDYKHGVGVYVDVVANEQLMFYALGVLYEISQMQGVNKDELPEEVTITIVQPRSRDTDEGVRSWTISRGDLSKFGLNLREAISATLEDDPPAVAGEYCQFCKAAGSCPALGEPTFEIVDRFGGDPEIDILTLDNDALIRVFEKRDLVKRFLVDVEKELMRRMQMGQCSDDRIKAINKLGRSAWKETVTVKAVTDAAAEYGISPGDLIYSQLLSPTQVKKVLDEKIADKAKAKEAKSSMELRFISKDSSGIKLALATEKGAPVLLTSFVSGLDGLTPPE